VLECVANLSEGRRPEVLRRLADGAGPDLLDLHSDPDHHRSVLTLVGEEAVRRVARGAADALDLRDHTGAHPRIGVIDVVPFVPYGGGTTMGDALGARDRFAQWAADELGVPCFVYGPERTLPDVRRGAFTTLRPDHGPDAPHPTAGAIAVGARRVLVAYNLWLTTPDLAAARRTAAGLRGPDVRALGLAVGRHVQVSCNLVEPDRVGPAEVYDRVATHASIARAELVGLVPRPVLLAIDPDRWSELDLAEDRTIEARVAAAG
jgi:glutamate formiminotransferase